MTRGSEARLWPLLAAVMVAYVAIVASAGLWYWQHDPLMDSRTVEQEMGRAR